MTGSEWLKSTAPSAMLRALRDRKVSDRKLRLFACACCRAVWPQLEDKRAHRAVEVAERYVEGRAAEKERQAASAAILEYAALTEQAPHAMAARWALTTRGSSAYLAAKRCSHNARRLVSGRGLQLVQARLLRDIFGNPFARAPALPPDVQARSGGTLVGLAEAIYQDRRLPDGALDGHRLAVLADALEEAGCTDKAIFSHLRSPGVHVRGCWAIDLVLGKA
jgi:hypothetical protein